MKVIIGIAIYCVFFWFALKFMQGAHRLNEDDEQKEDK